MPGRIYQCWLLWYNIEKFHFEFDKKFLPVLVNFDNPIIELFGVILFLPVFLPGKKNSANILLFS